MADLEVENTLREIRERVLAEAQERRAPAVNGATAAPAVTNGAESAAVAANGHASSAGEALAHMDANLATTARSWSRLPPLLSYRRGAAARFELWLKHLVKRAAHWFTWEQVNFNSAVHHALGDARAALVAQDRALAAQGEALAAQEQALAAHGEALAAHGERLAAHGERLTRVQTEVLAALRAEAETDRARVTELQARLAQAEARFESGVAQLRQAFAAGLERLAEAQHDSATELREGLRGELQTEREAQLAEIRTRAAELHAEFRERVDGLLEEQRVCFKQLSLEAGEAAVMHDRARRQLEARLEALEGKQWPVVNRPQAPLRER